MMVRMPSLQSKSVTTRQRILDAAARAFATRPYPSVRLTDIAKLAGMQAGSLYYYFGSKTELVDEVLRLGLETTWQRVREAVAAAADGTPISRVEAGLRAHAMVTLEWDSYSKAHARIIGQVPSAVRRKQEAILRRYGAYWNELLEDAADQVSSTNNLFVARMMALGAISYASEWYNPNGALSADDVADLAVSTIMHGLFGPTSEGIPERKRASRGDVGVETPRTRQRSHARRDGVVATGVGGRRAQAK
jgi:AcrR family transcriptional regulator